MKIEFYRGAEKITADAGTYPSSPSRSCRQTAAGLAEAARKGFAGVLQGIREVTAGLSEAEASRKPADKEWSVKELVAHFILCERDYQSWAADMLLDHPVNDDIEMRPNVDERITALVARLRQLGGFAD